MHARKHAHTLDEEDVVDLVLPPGAPGPVRARVRRPVVQPREELELGQRHLGRGDAELVQELADGGALHACRTGRDTQVLSDIVLGREGDSRVRCDASGHTCDGPKTIMNRTRRKTRRAHPRTHDGAVRQVLRAVRLAGLVPAQGVGAAGVGPHVREGDLAGGTLLEEEAALLVEEEDAERPVQEPAGLCVGWDDVEVDRWGLDGGRS